MPKVVMYNVSGQEVGEIELSETIFGVEVNEHVLYEVVKNQLANKRQGTQSAKTRAEVRGGGRKPWKQKGTGRGQVLCKAGTIKPHTKFTAEVYVLKKEEGGRHTPFFDGYRPQFYFRTTDVTGSTKLPDGMEMIMPGDNVSMVIELIHPIAVEEGLRFAIREGGRTVGSGVVASIIE